MGILSYENAIAHLKDELARAEAVVIGAGAGLSASAGFTYTGERFEKYFFDFHKKYGITDMYSGGFYPYKTLEENWAWWSRHIYFNRYVAAPKNVYRDLLALVKNANYFVLTTNVDHQFQKAGFDKTRLFYTQGDYGLWQCSEPCHQKTYDNESAVKKMIAAQGFVEAGGVFHVPHDDAQSRQFHNAVSHDTAACTSSRGRGLVMIVPSELVPYCPVCGKPMTMNLRADNTFVEDDGWHAASKRYADFLRLHEYARTLFLELGTGMNTPGIIKYPFWQMTHQWKNATYACINLGEAYAPKELAQKSICIDGDIGAVLEKLQVAVSL